MRRACATALTGGAASAYRFAVSAKRGAEAFREYYRALFGDRWEALESALRSPADSVPIAVAEDEGLLVGDAALAFAAESGSEAYFMDSASIFAARALNLPEEGKILDACAAPGGKSLVLAASVAAARDGRGRAASGVIANELSSDRRRRLAAVLDSRLPPAIRARVEIRGWDAASLCRRMPCAFGAILLDAPCSSERHVLADLAALSEWSPARVRNLAARQWALLSSAFLMLAPGGCLVYSTCALSPEENDRVAERLAAKYGAAAAFDPPSLAGAPAGSEATERGVAVLPDRASGAGPMYVCRVRKRR
ncbi:MAG: 16S rRNA methyltransferase [Spirochaetaceae bacterium]|nr:16S rRNA methyltransferase [Spirochaetaceae bacterium]